MQVNIKFNIDSTENSTALHSLSLIEKELTHWPGIENVEIEMGPKGFIQEFTDACKRLGFDDLVR